MRGLDATSWIKKHKFAEIRRGNDIMNRDNDDDINRQNIEFAKNLFISWDDDGSGSLQA